MAANRVNAPQTFRHVTDNGRRRLYAATWGQLQWSERGCFSGPLTHGLAPPAARVSGLADTAPSCGTDSVLNPSRRYLWPHFLGPWGPARW